MVAGPIRTFLESGVLVAAYKGSRSVLPATINILNDPARVFLSSPFVRYDFKRLFTLSEYYDRDRSAYYRAIRSVQERGLDVTEWLEYFTAGLNWQLTEVREKGAAVIGLEVLTKKHGLSTRQRASLELAAGQGDFQIGDFALKCPGVHRRSLQRDLKEVLEKGLLEAHGATTRLTYRLAVKI